MGAGEVTRLMGELLGMMSLWTATAADPACAQFRSPALSRAPSAFGVARQSIVDIRQSDLAGTLRRFSRETGRQVGFLPHLVRAKIASAVSGRFDPDVALARLLAGTGLSFRMIRDGYVLVALPLVRPVDPAEAALVGGMADPDVIVIGTRHGGGDATDIERRTPQPVSVLTDEDIRKLPDTSLADVARHIPGLQLSVRAGGGIVTIRGPSQIEERVNGRTLSSTVLRGSDIAALPANIVSGIDVYKTASATQIEAGSAA